MNDERLRVRRLHVNQFDWPALLVESYDRPSLWVRRVVTPSNSCRSKACIECGFDLFPGEMMRLQCMRMYLDVELYFIIIPWRMTIVIRSIVGVCGHEGSFAGGVGVLVATV